MIFPKWSITRIANTIAKREFNKALNRYWRVRDREARKLAQQTGNCSNCDKEWRCFIACEAAQRKLDDEYLIRRG